MPLTAVAFLDAHQPVTGASNSRPSRAVAALEREGHGECSQQSRGACRVLSLSVTSPAPRCVLVTWGSPAGGLLHTWVPAGGRTDALQTDLLTHAARPECEMGARLELAFGEVSCTTPPGSRRARGRRVWVGAVPLRTLAPEGSR